MVQSSVFAMMLVLIGRTLGATAPDTSLDTIPTVRYRTLCAYFGLVAYGKKWC